MNTDFLNLPAFEAYYADTAPAMYHFETYNGPIEVLAYSEGDAIRKAEELGHDLLSSGEVIV